jgi:hypothetical protein
MRTTQKTKTESVSAKIKGAKGKTEDQKLLYPEKLAWVNEMLKTAKWPSGEYLLSKEERES